MLRFSATGVESGMIGVDRSMRLTESLNLTIDQAGLENLTMSESKKDQLKAAFLLYCNGNIVRFRPTDNDDICDL